MIGIPRIGGWNEKEILIHCLEELLDILHVPIVPEVENDDVYILVWYR